MAIAPINGVNVRQNYNSTVNFAGSRKNDDGNERQNYTRTSKMATVPVVVLMAMTPGMMNGKQPITILPANDMNITEVLAQVPSIDMTKTYRTTEAQFSNQSGIDLSGYNPKDIQYKQYYTSNGKRWVMVWSDVGKDKFAKKNMVGSIDFVSEDYRQIKDEYGGDANNPPSLLKMVYHNLGDESKNFISVITRETVCDSNGENKKYVTKEYRIPDDVANKLIDLFVGDTEFEPRRNYNPSTILEEVNTARLKTPAELSNY